MLSLPLTMKAIVIQEFVQDASQLKLSDFQKPKRETNQVLIQIYSAAANFFDTLQIQGKYQIQPPFPWVAGYEFAGIIVESDLPGFAIGTRVFGGQQGAYAEYITVNPKVCNS